MDSIASASANHRLATVLGKKLLKKMVPLRGSIPMRILWELITVGILLLVILNEAASAQNQTAGRVLYATYCAACHGEQGKGNGVAAQGLAVKPADHTNGAVMNRLSDKFLMDIISKGGGAMGKSTFMPAWGNSLNEKQIGEVIAYIRSIAEPAYKLESPRKK